MGVAQGVATYVFTYKFSIYQELRTIKRLACAIDQLSGATEHITHKRVLRIYMHT